MKLTFFFIMAILLAFGLTSCNSNNDPEPVVKKTFTGCRLIKVKYLESWDSTSTNEREFIYDANHNIIEVKSYRNGQYNYSQTYTYDASGKIISSEPYGHIYEYNAAGLLTWDKNLGGSGGGKRFHYNAGGLVDSAWQGSFENGVYKPSHLFIFTYDSLKRLVKTISFGVNRITGVVDPLPSDIVETLAFDNFKNPYSLPSYTLRQIGPEIYFPKNNPLRLVKGSNITEISLVYRPDSLVSKSTTTDNYGYGGTTYFYYDCN